MTIFLTVLNVLINNQLSKRKAELLKTSNTPGYNKDLSTKLVTKITELSDYITTFDAVKQITQDQSISQEKKDALLQKRAINPDRFDTKMIQKQLKRSRKLIQIERDEGGEVKDGGETNDCVKSLYFHVEDFYEDLETKFPHLINRAHNKTTPNGIIYYYSAYFLGQQIFEPLVWFPKPKIRKLKEAFLKSRLEQLEREMKDNPPLHVQIDRCLQLIKDLLSDNVDAILEKKKESYLASAVTYLGEATGFCSNRLKQHFDMASSEIMDLQTQMQQILLGNLRFTQFGGVVAPRKSMEASATEANSTSAITQEEHKEQASPLIDAGPLSEGEEEGDNEGDDEEEAVDAYAMLNNS